jgi:F0F1-type ATP synthase assembly protein I
VTQARESLSRTGVRQARRQGVGNTAKHGSLFVQFLWAQALAMLAVAGVGLGYGVEAAYSALLGGMSSLVPDFYFARRVFRRYTGKSADEIGALMLRAEVVKISLTALMFGAIFASMMALNVVALILGYLSVKAAGVVVSVRVS